MGVFKHHGKTGVGDPCGQSLPDYLSILIYISPFLCVSGLLF